MIFFRFVLFDEEEKAAVKHAGSKMRVYGSRDLGPSKLKSLREDCERSINGLNRQLALTPSGETGSVLQLLSESEEELLQYLEYEYLNNNLDVLDRKCYNPR